MIQTFALDSMHLSRRGATLCAAVGLIVWLAVGAIAQEPPKKAASSEPSTAMLPRLQAGTAVVERLGPVFEDGAGPFVATHAGDWRLSNERVSFTFASVDDLYSSVSLPVGGHQPLLQEGSRVPGALIDVATESERLDFLSFFTQGIGLANDVPPILYDTAQAVQNEAEVGLRLEGSPYETSLMRLATTYWLSADRDALRIETRLMGRASAEPFPAICDVGNWGTGTLFTQGGGYHTVEETTDMPPEFYLVNGGSISLGIAPREGLCHGWFRPGPQLSRVLVAPGAQGIDLPTTAGLVSEAADTVLLPIRDMWLARGDNAQVVAKMLRDRSLPSSELVIKAVVGQDGPPAANIEFEILRHDVKRKNLFPYVMARTDAQGRVSVHLPVSDQQYEDWFVPRPFERADRKGLEKSGLKLKPGETSTMLFDLPPRTGVHIQAIDEQTRHPLAARVRFEAIQPTPPVNLGFPTQAAAYIDTAILPREGRTVYLPAGSYIVKGTHGLRYNMSDNDLSVSEGKITQLTLTLDQDNPTTGWMGVEVGARTVATPGCTVTADDMALMAAAEDLEWIISGDFEQITDLNPSIKKLGFEDRLKAIRGFRTLLPAHPEWGQFLLYPIAENAPDPAQVKDQWAALTDAHDFIATLRRLYPGAMIQVETPFTKSGQGYFAHGQTDPYVMSWRINPAVDLDVDALNLFPPNFNWPAKELLGFYYNLRSRGLNYLASTGATGRTVFGATPGYPRILVFTGEDAVAKVTEKKLFEAIRAHRTQITNAPFLDVWANEQRPGALIPINQFKALRLALYCPLWTDVSNLNVTKEAPPQSTNIMGVFPNSVRRDPPPDSMLDFTTYTAKDLSFARGKDTLLGVDATGMMPIKEAVPTYNPFAPPKPLCVISPFIIDENLNGKYDPLTSYAQKGM